jgi:hypothetical protein
MHLSHLPRRRRSRMGSVIGLPESLRMNKPKRVSRYQSQESLHACAARPVGCCRWNLRPWLASYRAEQCLPPPSSAGWPKLGFSLRQKLLPCIFQMLMRVESVTHLPSRCTQFRRHHHRIVRFQFHNKLPPTTIKPKMLFPKNNLRIF